MTEHRFSESTPVDPAEEQRRALANASTNLIALIKLVGNPEVERRTQEAVAHSTIKWFAHFVTACQAAAGMQV